MTGKLGRNRELEHKGKKGGMWRERNQRWERRRGKRRGGFEKGGVGWLR